MSNLIAINNLNFSYDRSRILENINFSINQGERWAIIGKNGTGKSTLIKCVGNLLPIPRGSILIKSKDLHEYNPKEYASHVAYVPQPGNRILPPFTVYDFVLMGRFPYQNWLKIPSQDDKKIVIEALELTDTLNFADRIISTLSGGEIQRVFLASAVAQMSPILLLDEPTAFLDPLHQVLVQRALDRIHDQYKTTIITVTHDISAAVSKYDHILAIKDGKQHFAGLTSLFKTNCPHILHEIFSITFDSIKHYDEFLFVPGENNVSNT